MGPSFNSLYAWKHVLAGLEHPGTRLVRVDEGSMGGLPFPEQHLCIAKGGPGGVGCLASPCDALIPPYG